MTYVIAEPCIDTKDKSWLPFVEVNAAWANGGAEAVRKALESVNGGG